jgi:CRP-like cAMP-binding protein/tetratricopeptide (TPR) repeat protein
MSVEKSKHRAGALKKQALELLRKGSHDKALAALAKLEALEPTDGEWPRRAAECHRERGDTAAQVEALGRATECYAGNGENTKAIAMCKVILGLEPGRLKTQKRLSELTDAFNRNSQRSPALRQIQSLRVLSSERAPKIVVDSLAPTGAGASAPPPLRVDAQARVSLQDALRQRRAARAQEARSRPEGTAVDAAEAAEAPDATVTLEAIPALDELISPEHQGPMTLPAPAPEFAPEDPFDPPSQELVEQSRELALRALPSTPLFSELGPDALSPLIQRATLVSMAAGELVYRESDPADALYVIVSGSVAIVAGDAPRMEIVRLGENEFFGENALLDNELRPTSVEALEPTALLRIERAVLRELLEDQPRALKVLLRFLRERMVQHLLQTNPLLGLLSLRERRALAARFEFRKLDAGELLIEQGQRSPGLFILLSGTIDVLLHEAGDAHPVALLHAGAVFGEMSLLGEPRATADVRSVSEGFTFLLPEHEFRHAVAAHPVLLEFATLLAESRRVHNSEFISRLRDLRTSAPPDSEATDQVG